ncbi:MAG TPA: succinate dehydrogenase, partial [Desulfosarcina sp.]|nr:succinate dehydrogenase [Desulfosarcina sp.]
MNWITGTLGSSIGKKLMMAVTGFSFCGFLVTHLAGNLTIYGGRDAFNSYAEHLHSLGPLVTAAELVLLTLFLVHVGTGVILFLQNLKARPVRYAVNKNAGGRTLGSATMPYTGVLILAFIVFHLLN